MTRTNRNNIFVFVSIGVIATLVFLFTKGNQQSAYINIITAFSVVSTTLIAFNLYDRLDSKKLAFNKRSEAVDNLVTSLSNMKLKFVICSRGEITKQRNTGKVSFSTIDFHLNFHNLKACENMDYHTVRVFFSKNVLQKFSMIMSNTVGPWLPIEIGQKLKPIIIFDDFKTESVELSEKFFLVIDPSEKMADQINFYSITYGDLRIPNYISYLNYNRSLLVAIQDWYLKYFNDSPDLQGDYKVPEQ